MKQFKFVKSIENESVRSVLFIAFALIFTLPLLIFFLTINNYNLLHERNIQISIAVCLTFSLFGLILLRQVMEEIITISDGVKKISWDKSDESISRETNELKTIAHTFQKLVKKLGRRVSELSSLRELTEIASKIFDLHKLYSDVLNKLITTTDSSRGMMLSLKNEGKKMCIEAVYGIDTESLPDGEIDINGTVFEHISHGKDVAVYNEPNREPIFNTSLDTLFEGRPCLAKAIKVRGKIITFLFLSRREHGEIFEDEALNYITAALGQIAFAFDNAQLIRELKDSYNELKKLQQQLVTYERVEAINHTVVTLNEKINNPLSVIQGHVELIRKNFRIDDEKFIHSLELIEESVQKCNDIMTQLRSIRNPTIKNYPDIGTAMIDIDT